MKLRALATVSTGSYRVQSGISIATGTYKTAPLKLPELLNRPKAVILILPAG